MFTRGDRVQSTVNGRRGEVVRVKEDTSGLHPSVVYVRWDGVLDRDYDICEFDFIEKVPEFRQPAGENPKDRIGATKPDLSLVPPAGLIHVATAMKNGADKYGAYNWRGNAVQAMTYIAAAQRHILSWLDGEEVAEDSGVHHLAHAAACLFIVLDALETGNLVDNRPEPGAAGRLITEYTKEAPK